MIDLNNDDDVIVSSSMFVKLQLNYKFDKAEQNVKYILEDELNAWNRSNASFLHTEDILLGKKGLERKPKLFGQLI